MWNQSKRYQKRATLLRRATQVAITARRTATAADAEISLPTRLPAGRGRRDLATTLLATLPVGAIGSESDLRRPVHLRFWPRTRVPVRRVRYSIRTYLCIR